MSEEERRGRIAECLDIAEVMQARIEADMAEFKRNDRWWKSGKSEMAAIKAKMDSFDMVYARFVSGEHFRDLLG